MLPRSKLFIFFIIFLLAGCTTVDQKLGRKLNKDMMNDFSYAAKTNAKIAKKKSFVNPEKIISTLTPEINTLTKSDKDQRYSITVDKINVKEFFKQLNAELDVNFILDPKLNATITMSVKDLTLPQMFDAIISTTGHKVEIVKTAYGFWVRPPVAVTKSYSIDMIPVERAHTNMTGLASSGLASEVKAGKAAKFGKSSPMQMTTKGSNKNLFKTIKTQITTIMKSQGDAKAKLVIDENTYTALVTALPQTQSLVADFINQLNKKLNQQVLIEMRILDFQIANSTTRSWLATFKYLGNIGISPGSTTNNGSTIGWTPNSTSGTAWQAVLGGLETLGHTVTLSAPSMLTLNNQESIIKMGTDQQVATAFTTGTSSVGSGLSTISSVTTQTFFSGVALTVIPHVSENGQAITLYCHPVISKVTAGELTVVASSTAGTAPVTSDIQEVDNVLNIRDGQVIALATLDEGSYSHGKSSSAALHWLNNTSFPMNLADSSTKGIKIVLLRAKIIKPIDHSEILSQIGHDYSTLSKMSKMTGGYRNIP